MPIKTAVASTLSSVSTSRQICKAVLDLPRQRLCRSQTTYQTNGSFLGGVSYGAAPLELLDAVSPDRCADVCDQETECVAFEYDEGASVYGCTLYRGVYGGATSAAGTDFGFKNTVCSGTCYDTPSTTPSYAGSTTAAVTTTVKYSSSAKVTTTKNPTTAPSSTTGATPTTTQGSSQCSQGTYYASQACECGYAIQCGNTYNLGTIVGELTVANADRCADACDQVASCVNFQYTESSGDCQLLAGYSQGATSIVGVDFGFRNTVCGGTCYNQPSTTTGTTSTTPSQALTTTATTSAITTPNGGSSSKKATTTPRTTTSAAAPSSTTSAAAPPTTPAPTTSPAAVTTTTTTSTTSSDDGCQHNPDGSVVC